MASLPTARASRGTPRCYGATRSGRRARGGGIARELEVRERGLQIAARSKLLRVLRGERRKIRMVLDRSKYFDRLAVRLVGRAEVATRVSGCGADAQRVGLLAVVAKIGKAGSGALGKAKRILGIAFLERDPRAQDVDDRAHTDIAGERGALAAAIDRLACGVHVAVLELHRRERLHDGELHRGVGDALEQSERALVVAERTVELARVVERDGYAQIALRGEAQLAGSRRHGERELIRREGFFFSSRRRHTSCSRDWSSDVCSSDLFDGFSYPNFRTFTGFMEINF